MKTVTIFPIIILILLSGCYCAFDSDEQSKGTLDYFSGCWNKAKHG